MKKVVQQKVSSDGSEKATEGLIHNQNSMRERENGNWQNCFPWRLVLVGSHALMNG